MVVVVVVFPLRLVTADLLRDGHNGGARQYLFRDAITAIVFGDGDEDDSNLLLFQQQEHSSSDGASIPAEG